LPGIKKDGFSRCNPFAAEGRGVALRGHPFVFLMTRYQPLCNGSFARSAGRRKQSLGAFLPGMMLTLIRRQK
jgi:hypothetical protein